MSEENKVRDGFGPGVYCSEDTLELSRAIARAQRKVRKAVKDSNNPHLGSKYADLEACWDATEEARESEGLCFTWTVLRTSGDGDVVVRTKIFHEPSGQWKASDVSWKPFDSKGINQMQVAALITSYLRRITLSAELGLCTSDGDGQTHQQNGSSNGHAKQQQPAKRDYFVQAKAAIPKYTTDQSVSDCVVWIERQPESVLTKAQKDELLAACKAQRSKISETSSL